MAKQKLLTLFTFILAFQFNSLFTTSTPTTLTTSSKEQIQCSMCSSCDNPCQPVPSPPPPPPPEIICPPPPPPPCEPPPPPPCAPPPPVIECIPPCTKPVPRSGAIGGSYFPPGSDGTQYFPYYKPPPSIDASNSVILRLELAIIFISLFLSLLFLN